MPNPLVRKFGNNVLFAFAAQGFSLLVSILMSLVVPKLLGLEQFAYWQLFIFYTSYIGLFHFGVSDGVYLRYGGVSLDQLDPAVIGSQLKLMTIFHVGIGCVVAAGAFLFAGQERGIVWLFTAINLVLCNIYWYLGYIFQATNETKIYSLATILNKASFAIFIVVLIFAGVDSFVPVTMLYTVAQVLATGYILWRGRRFLLAPMLPLKQSALEAAGNAKIGINLTFSNIASSLILGIGRVFVDVEKGLQAFGQVSFAISLTNFFLQFISQVSMVMFPMLRQLHTKRIRKLYELLRSGLSYLLCFILVLYGPMKFVLTRWLPQYAVSFQYLTILLPICIFDGEMQLLYNTYLKVLRKEKTLLLINVFVLILSTCLNAIAVFVLKNIMAVAFSMLVAIIIRSLITNEYLSATLNITVKKNTIWECGISVIFVLSYSIFEGLVPWLINLGAMLVYLYCGRYEIKECVAQFSKMKE